MAVVRREIQVQVCRFTSGEGCSNIRQPIHGRLLEQRRQDERRELRGRGWHKSGMHASSVLVAGNKRQRLVAPHTQCVSLEISQAKTTSRTNRNNKCNNIISKSQRSREKLTFAFKLDDKYLLKFVYNQKN